MLSIKYSLLILLLIVIVIISFQPYVSSLVLERFDDAMYISDAAARFQKPNYNLNDSLLQSPKPLYIPQPIQTNNVESGFESSGSEFGGAGSEGEFKIQQQPVPLDPCACNCEDLQRQINDGCSNVQTLLDQCNLRLSELNLTCETQKGQMVLNSAQNQVNKDSELSQKKEESVQAQTKLLTCTQDNNRLSMQNQKLLQETSELRQQLLSLQDKILQANNDTQECQLKYQDFENKFDNMTTRFSSATQQYKGVTDKFYEVAGDYMNFVDNIDQCAKLSFKYDDNVKKRANDRRKQVALEQSADSDYGAYTMSESSR
jgi:hypothetical protein